MNRLVRAEFLKVRTTQVWFWLLLGTAAVSAALVVAQIAGDAVKSARDVPDLFTSSGTAYIVVYILGVLGVTTEFRYQTITPTLLQTPSRWAVVSAKMIAYAILGIGYALVAVVVQLAVALPWLSARNITVDFTNGQVQHSIIAVFGVVALFGIVGLGAGALMRNQVVAVVVGIVLLLVLQNVLVAIPGVKRVYPFTPGGATAAITHTTGSASINGVALLPTYGGVVALVLWAFIPAIIGASVTMNRDIT